MASVEKRVRDGRTTYVTRWRDDAGRQRKRSFARKVDADRYRAEVEHGLNVGTYVDPAAGRETLRAYVERRWLPAQVHLRPTSAALYRSHLATHILPALGGRQVRALRRTDAKNLVASLAATLAPSTVTTVYAVLRAVMASAVDDGLITGNPCSRVPLPRVEPRVLVPPTAEQVATLAAAITPRYEVSVWLGAGAGLREGEVFGLLASRVQFLRRRILVEEQGQGGKLVPLKTRASKAPVPVDDLVLAKVGAHLARWPVNSTGLVMTNRAGAMVRRSSFGHCWREAVAATGMPAGTRFHDLRHFYASTLIAAGLYPKVVQARLRHATLSETMDTYGHLFPDAEEHGRGALDAAFSDVPRMRPEAAAE